MLEPLIPRGITLPMGRVGRQLKEEGKEEEPDFSTERKA